MKNKYLSIYNGIYLILFMPFFLEGSVYAFFDNLTNPLYIPQMVRAKKVVLTRGEYQGKPAILGIYQINPPLTEFMKHYEQKIRDKGMKVITSSYAENLSVLVARDNRWSLGAIAYNVSGNPMLMVEKIKGKPQDLMWNRGRDIPGIPPPPGGNSVFYNEQSNGNWAIKEVIYETGASLSEIIDFYKEEMNIRGWKIGNMPDKDYYEKGIFFSKDGKECMVGADEENGRTGVIIILKE